MAAAISLPKVKPAEDSDYFHANESQRQILAFGFSGLVLAPNAASANYAAPLCSHATFHLRRR